MSGAFQTPLSTYLLSRQQSVRLIYSKSYPVDLYPLTPGYGHLTPGAPQVRLLSLVLALVAVPLASALVSQLASGLASLLSLLRLSRLEPGVLVTEDSLAPSASLLLSLLAMFTVSTSLVFSLLWDWELPDSVYFVVTTVSTIGFGDILPAESLSFLMAGGGILVGLSLFSLWQDCVVVRLYSHPN